MEHPVSAQIVSLLTPNTNYRNVGKFPHESNKSKLSLTPRI